MKFRLFGSTLCSECDKIKELLIYSQNQYEFIDVDDDKDAVKAAKAARGKFKKLDLAVKSLNDIKKEMISYAKEYGKSDDESRKEEIKNILRKKTPIKKELESLVKKLEKDAV